MRCTSCSKLVRPVVALDIDGTLGDYHGHLLNFAKEYLGRQFGSAALYQGAGPFSEWFQEAFGCDYRTFRDVKLAYRQGGMKRSMRPYSNAALLTREVRMAGAEIWITTTRPFNRLDNIDPDTQEWLRRNSIEFNYLLPDDNKYNVLAERVDRERVVAVLDDLPEMLQQADEAIGEGIAIPRITRYNNAVVSDRRGAVRDLIEASDLILGRIETWKESNALA